MDNILILDGSTINKIAAGEVVERPASIIKELVENSIDADSTAITIEIRDGGTSYIRVTDNGKGMSHHDARMSFERHATSKISSAPDLDNVLTLGFRGEALASIAAVTRMEMITRTVNSISGINIINQGGKVIVDKEIGCPEGTTIITQNLFFNTPARLKFLKSPRAETANISDLVGKLILAHPEIAFKYINNGKTIYHSSGDGELRHAILSIYGKDVVDEILSMGGVDNSREIQITGYLGKPSLSRKNRNHQSFFINGRYVKSMLLAESVEKACQPYLTINQFPWVILHLNLPPNMIDVNVHPAKTQVRFREEDHISQIIEQHVGNVLSKNPYIPALKQSSFIHPPKEEAFSSISFFPEEEYSPPYDPPSMEEESKDIYVKSLSDSDKSMVDNLNMDNIRMNNDVYDNNNYKAFSIPKKIVGEIFATYIIVEGEEKCFLIDQHAAHERLLFEKYKKMVLDQEVATQQLLPPLIIEVTHGEQIMINESMELFHSLGFEIEEFGGKAFSIRGVPMIFGSSNPKDFFQGLLDELEEFVGESRYKLKIDDIIQMSCKKAIKAGDRLSDMEITALLDDLLSNKIPMTCPHGRPIMITITKNELEKMFKRIQ